MRIIDHSQSGTVVRGRRQQAERRRSHREAASGAGGPIRRASLCGGGGGAGPMCKPSSGSSDPAPDRDRRRGPGARRRSGWRPPRAGAPCDREAAARPARHRVPRVDPGAEHARRPERPYVHRFRGMPAQLQTYRDTKFAALDAQLGPSWRETSFGDVDIKLTMRSELLSLRGTFDDYFNRPYVPPR
jgi:hypothetical protein